MISPKKIKDALKKAIHPELNKNLLKLSMIREIKTQSNKVIITLVIPFLHIPIKKQLINIIKKTIKENLNINANVNVQEMNNNEKKKFGDMVKEIRGLPLIK